MKPIVLAILDGWGLSEKTQNNALKKANTPNFDRVQKLYPFCCLQASGIAVGLPWNEPGNSEVGHLVIGSGRTVYQYLPRISMEIKSGKFFNKPALIKTAHHVRKNKSALHIMGLVSSGNVHSYIEHLYGLLEFARREKIKKVCIHAFTDGKDAPLKESKKILQNLQESIKQENWGIATIIGREYPMDRNKNWDKTKKAYDLLTQGKGEKAADPVKRIEEQYQKGLTDTYIEPTVITDKKNNPKGLIQDNDAIIFFNFREDSARQLTRTFMEEKFNKFERKKINNLFFCAFTQYSKELPIEVAYPPIKIQNHLTEYLSKKQRRILKTSETQKYAHVTYFFNGGKEKKYPGEDRKLIPPQKESCEKKPELQTEKLTDIIIQGIKKEYDLIVANYVNADVIAHTGNLEATAKGIEAIDKGIGRLISLAEKNNYILILTADHGNAEEMMNIRTGEKITEHSTNPVPFLIIEKGNQLTKPRTEEETREMCGQPQGILCDIAPTILELMKIDKPPEMTGESLLDIF
ncbi:MAG: 2,3-bisphosphoglycerate-independent phosphoglycerate mutase [Candidatus Portnoybacteria bacterium]|nr:2,3-bisphosphoglycerate-independent phosphoglycerate mutase [Candidatus Portnoybacteria bacterium]